MASNSKNLVQKKGEKSDRPRPAAVPKTTQPGPELLAPGLRRPAALNGLSEHNTARPLRQATVLRLQHSRGNAHARRFVQRQAGGTTSDQPSTEVPGLSRQQFNDAHSNLSTQPQTAVDAVVQGLADRGKINLSHIDNGTVLYVSDASRFPANHYGLTSLTPGSGFPRPCRMEVGSPALSSVSMLYTTIMHEYQHVLELRAGGFGPDGEARGEVEARLWEIENLEESGLWRDARYMGRLPGQLSHWWQQLESPDDALLERYEQAQTILTEMRQRLEDEQFRQQTGR